MTADHVITFWFEEIETASWFRQSDDFDQLIRSRFGSTFEQARCGELADWRTSPQGRLAEIILLDQFSRNLYRNSAEAYGQDGMALVLAQEAIADGAAKALEDAQKSFLYMPYMHSESKAVHEIAVKLFSEAGLDGNLEFELKHKTIIDRFGRYPHRNSELGRESTPEELEFIAQPGNGF